VLVNNAGISGSAEQDFYSTEAWHRIMAVNPTGVFFLIKYAIPAMVANGGGSIVNLSSIAGIIGSEHVHMASKTVVRLMTKSVAVQHIRAWLFTIMLNQYANMVRRASREQATVDIEQMSSALVATTDPTASRQLRELERRLAAFPASSARFSRLSVSKACPTRRLPRSSACRSAPYAHSYRAAGMRCVI
jgi:NAD(P)-dependent dehydrogenase (short-subunit alcohol dehydrogenase family)